MKKIFPILLIVLILITGACSKKEEKSAVAKDVVNESNNTQQIKENELAIRVNGKTEIIPVETKKNIGFATEVKVPVGTEAKYNLDSNMLMFTDYTEGTFINIQLTETELSIDDFLNDISFRGFLRTHSKAKDIQLEGYPELKYDRVVNDGEDYGLVKEIKIGEKRFIQQVSIKANTNKKLNTLLSMLISMKHTPDYQIVDETITPKMLTFIKMPILMAVISGYGSFDRFDTPEQLAIIDKINALTDTFKLERKSRDSYSYDDYTKRASILSRNPANIFEVYSFDITINPNRKNYIIVSHEIWGKGTYYFYEYDEAKANDLISYMESLQPDRR